MRAAPTRCGAMTPVPSRDHAGRSATVRCLRRSLIGALWILALCAAGAQADETISITVGNDPTEEVPVPISVTWSSATASPSVFVTVKPAGGQGCAPSYAADAANSSDVLSGGGSASGSESENRTFSDPGNFTLCGYLQDGSSSSAIVRKATGPVGMAVRSAKASVAITVPPRVDPGQTFQLSAAVTSELSRSILVTVKPFGGRGCEPNYAADATVSSDVISSGVQGSQTVQTNTTASEITGGYLLCAYVQEQSDDVVPEAIGFARFLVGPNPTSSCATARSQVRAQKRVIKKLRSKLRRTSGSKARKKLNRRLGRAQRSLRAGKRRVSARC